MYVIAIPSYRRPDELVAKTLMTLQHGGIDVKGHVYIFVANLTECRIYEERVPREMYHRIVVGVKGITRQRRFISQYFAPGQQSVSLDDDIENVQHISNGRLIELRRLDTFFRAAFEKLKQEGLYLWGIYPVNNLFYMESKVPITTDLKFILGTMHGYINRHEPDLWPHIKSETKEDYEQSWLFFNHDGGVVRFNHVAVKTKPMAKGGLGTDRRESALSSAAFLCKRYPEIFTQYERENGRIEVRMKRMKRMERFN